MTSETKINSSNIKSKCIAAIKHEVDELCKNFTPEQNFVKGTGPPYTSASRKSSIS